MVIWEPLQYSCHFFTFVFGYLFFPPNFMYVFLKTELISFQPFESLLISFVRFFLLFVFSTIVPKIYCSLR